MADLRAAWDYIADQNEPAADRTIYRIQEAAEHLTDFPELGRAGKVRGSREFVVTDTSYLLVYEIAAGLVQIRRVLHGAQEWPPRRKRA